jgi:hypothetical protein
LAQARFDKQGRRLPDTGHGCGCRLCAEANAPRYERRSGPERSGEWGSLQRWLMRLVHGLGGRGRSELA